MTTPIRHVVAVAVLCLAAAPPMAAQDYRFEKISVPGSLDTEAIGISARGDIVGRYSDADGVNHSFLLRKGKFTTIEVPGAAETLAARGINARGDIVGNFHDADFVRHGYLLRDGTFTQIDYPGALATVVERINNAGDVMGFYADATDIGHGFIRRDGEFHTVRLPGGSSLIVRSAQDNGTVLAGTVALDRDGGFRGFVTNRQGQFELIEYPSLKVPCTGARFVNQRGDIVGGVAIINSVDECAPPFEESHGFLLRDGRFTLIDVPGSPSTDAMAINDDGVIVGRYLDQKGRFRGFKATPGR